MGNEEIIGRGGIQFTSAGKGITHSEYNADADTDVTLLQVWIVPEKQNLKPSYRTKHFSDDDKRNKLQLIISRDGRQGTIRIHQQCEVFASILEPGQSVNFELIEGRVGYLHLILGSGKLILNTDYTLMAGDGAFLTGPVSLQITNGGKKNAEFLLFDLPPS